LLRRNNGRLQAVGSTGRAGAGIDFGSIGATPGARATLVQFSSSFCAPCRSTRQILSDVAELVDGVTYVEIDAESHLELVRAHQILRTPTTLVLDADGAIVVRASGQPRKADVIAALGRAIDRSTTTSPTP
jgi:thiol-disulfide isomerase/thioredoxin